MPQGSEYHSAAPGPSRTRVAPCLRLSGLPAARVLDPAFWANSLALWARAEPSEFCRLEVVYDVLLPWLADHAAPTLLPTAHHLATTQARAHTAPRPPLAAASAADPGLFAAAESAEAAADAGAAAATAVDASSSGDEFRSASRSGAAGAWKAALEAVRYTLRRSGLFSRSWLKALTLAVRCALLARASADLEVVARLNRGAATATFESMRASGAAPPPPTVAEALAAVSVPYPQLPAATALATCGALLASLQPTAAAAQPGQPGQPPLPEGVLAAVPVLGSGAQVLLLYFTKSDCPHCATFAPVQTKHHIMFARVRLV